MPSLKSFHSLPPWLGSAPIVAIAALGGFIASLIGLPAPWLLGSALLVIAVGLGGYQPPKDMKLQLATLSLLGVMVGTGFTPEVIAFAGAWMLSLSLVLVSTAGMTLTGAAYCAYVARYNRPTAWLSGVPGGLQSMIVLAPLLGADTRKVAVSQALRLSTIVHTVPLLLVWLGGVQPPPPAELAKTPIMEQPLDLAALAVCAVAGYLLAGLMRFPSTYMIIPMTLSAVLHGTGVIDADPPTVFVVLAQVVIGVLVGSSMIGASAREMALTILHGIGLAGALLAISFVFAFAAHLITGLPLSLLYLAHLPGGAPEMSIVAIALGLDPAFVAVHHLVRLFAIVLILPYALEMFAKRAERLKQERDRARRSLSEPGQGEPRAKPGQGEPQD